ncbi:translation initiation factor IF-2-like, partial [Rattus rattus]|uniref:translation initiation factor IF-2-like n=1 Tax=Rattus rattus TaxID=10117 RepID=UPI0013F32D7B
MTKENNSFNEFSFLKPISISDFAKSIGVDASEIIKDFFLKGKLTTLNTILSKEECKNLCEIFKITFTEKQKSYKEDNLFSEYLDFSNSENVVPKIPVVTVMGHVDHGKTTLLDRIRGTKVTASEFGGITQHIGAYQVTKGNQKITFLDTPGHQAFTKMRYRGANVTDIAIIVVAADDGVKPQTIEAIQHALAAKVKIIVFINKVDKGRKSIPVLKNQVMEHGLILEEFGGDVLCVEGSALQGTGIDELLDTILLVAEVSEFKTTQSNPAVGTVIESNLEKGLGAVATVLLDRGVVSCGDFLVMKSAICKIRTITNDEGKTLKKLEAAVPARITGFKNLPDAGDRFISFSKEAEAKKFFGEFSKDSFQKDLVFLEKNKDVENLNILVRADVSGSLEAIKEIIYSHNISISAANIGPVTEADLQLASITGSLIMNFNQKITSSVLNRAQEMRIKIKNYRSVYEIEEDLIEIIENNKYVEYVEETTVGDKVTVSSKPTSTTTSSQPDSDSTSEGTTTEETTTGTTTDTTTEQVTSSGETAGTTDTGTTGTTT